MNIFSNTSHKGFVILFAVLISAIILMITMGIFSISTKQTMLASSSREAHRALNVADAAVECALYLEISEGPLQGTVASNVCPGANIDASFSGSSTRAEVEYDFLRTEACAYVTISDVSNSFADGTTVTDTTIKVRGFNLCDTDKPLFRDPLLVERVYEVSYTRTPVVAPGTGGGGGAGGN